VSVTSVAERDGSTEWFLTKESGRMPGGQGCEAHGAQGGGDLRGSYAIHVRKVPKYPFTVVFIAGLCDMAMEVCGTLARVDAGCLGGYSMCGAAADELAMDRQACVWRSVGNGAYSSGERCKCSEMRAVEAGTVCESCSALEAGCRLFVEQDCFLGVHPRGTGHWFHGVTDAVPRSCGTEWMRYGYALLGDGGGMTIVRRCDECAEAQGRDGCCGSL
jgi:hypothetical protein